jgi:hypothetical protein
MTVEHRLLLELGDITALTFECEGEQCRARLSLPPDTVSGEKLQRCPRCNRDWLAKDSDLGQSTNEGVFGRFVLAIREARKATHPGFKMFLEFRESAK